MDVGADGVAYVFQRRKQIQALKMTLEPEYLRFSQARFEPLAKNN